VVEGEALEEGQEVAMRIAADCTGSGMGIGCRRNSADTDNTIEFRLYKREWSIFKILVLKSLICILMLLLLKMHPFTA